MGARGTKFRKDVNIFEGELPNWTATTGYILPSGFTDFDSFNSSFTTNQLPTSYVFSGTTVHGDINVVVYGPTSQSLLDQIDILLNTTNEQSSSIFNSVADFFVGNGGVVPTLVFADGSLSGAAGTIQSSNGNTFIRLAGNLNPNLIGPTSEFRLFGELGLIGRHVSSFVTLVHEIVHRGHLERLIRDSNGNVVPQTVGINEPHVWSNPLYSIRIGAIAGNSSFDPASIFNIVPDGMSLDDWIRSDPVYIATRDSIGEIQTVSDNEIVALFPTLFNRDGVRPANGDTPAEVGFSNLMDAVRSELAKEGDSSSAEWLTGIRILVLTYQKAAAREYFREFGVPTDAAVLQQFVNEKVIRLTENGEYELVPLDGGTKIESNIATLEAAGESTLGVDGSQDLSNDELLNNYFSTLNDNIARREFFSGVGSIVGSSIGSLLADQLELDGLGGTVVDIVSSAVFGQIGSAFGQALSGNIDPNDTATFIDRLVDQFDGAEQDDVIADAFSIGALSEALEQGVKGTISSLLTAELADVLGLDGAAGEVFGVVGNSLLNSILADANGANDVLIAAGEVFEGFADVVFNQDLSAFTDGGSLASLPGAVGGFLGGKLGSLVVSPTTQAGAVLSSLGSSVGAAIGSSLLGKGAGLALNVLLPGVGAFVGFVLGALIGNLFGKKPPPIPMADASTVLNFSDGYYELGVVNSNESGSEGFAKNMAETAANTLNAFIDVVGGKDLDARNINTVSPTQIYGHEGNQTYVTIAGTRHDVDTPDEAIDIGALYAIKRTEIAGGNLFMKRAVLASTADNLASFGGDLQIAEDYATYKLNQETIDAAIAAPYESLSETDKTFYNDNEANFLAFQRRDHEAITGTPVQGWHEANYTQVVRITDTLNSVSTFAAGWIITLQRAAELGLNKSAESDFYGGAQGFIDSLSGLVNRPISYQDIAFTMDGQDLKVYYDADRDGHADADEELLFTETGMTRATTHADGGAGFNDAGSGHSDDSQVTGGNDIGINLGNIGLPGSPNFNGAGDDILIGRAIAAQGLNGGAGRDWIDGLSGHDLLWGGTGDDILLGREGDDKLYGEDGDDILYAGAGTDRLYGGNGDDELHGAEHNEVNAGHRRNYMYGGAGDDKFYTYTRSSEVNSRDYFYGQSGTDLGSFRHYDAGIALTLSESVNFWHEIGNNFVYFSSVEGVEGTAFADTLTGNSSDNTLIGGAGDDVITSGGGSNIIEGGAGADTLIGNYTSGNRNTLSYESSLGGVDVSLGASAGVPNSHAFGGDASGDIIQGVFFNITGSNYSDVLEGDYRSNTLTGLEGDDYFIASRGYDVYNGGRGFDTVDYSNHAGASGLVINTVLGNSANGYDNGNEAHSLWGLHNYSEIEHIVGTDHADTITTGDLDNVLEGGAGNDILRGGNGNDIYFIEVDGGHDQIYELADGGYDTLMLGAGDYTWNNVVISDLGANFELTVGTYGVVATAHNSPADHREDVGVDALDVGGVGAIEIWHLNSDGGLDVTIDANGREVQTGDAGKNNLLQGFGGRDVLYGHTGNDFFNGGIGNDSLFGGTGDDQYVFDRDSSPGKNWDVIYDLGGIDHIQFGPNIRAEELVFTINNSRTHLYIGIAEAGTTDTTGMIASQMDDYIVVSYGGDLNSGRMVEYITVDNINIDIRTLDLPFYNAPSGNGAGNGNPPVASAPIVFDLNNNGYTDMVSIDESKIVIQNGQNQYTRIGWVGPEDGILALDRNGNGIIDNFSEISFLDDLKGATSDIDALRAYDSNQDGVFDSNDARFGEFLILRDRDQNGIGSGEELVSLADAGIASIDLTAQSLGRDIRDNADNVNLNIISYQTTSGEQRTAYDVALGASIISGGQESYSSSVTNLSVSNELSANAAVLDGESFLAGALGSVSFDRSAFIENEILSFDFEGLSDEQANVVSELTQGAWAQLGRNRLDRMIKYRDGMIDAEQDGVSTLDMYDTGQSESSVVDSFAASRSLYAEEILGGNQSSIAETAFVPEDTLGSIATVESLVAVETTKGGISPSSELDVFNQAMAAFGGTNGTDTLAATDNAQDEEYILGQSSIWRSRKTSATLLAS